MTNMDNLNNLCSLYKTRNSESSVYCLNLHNTYKTKVIRYKIRSEQFTQITYNVNGNLQSKSQPNFVKQFIKSTEIDLQPARSHNDLLNLRGTDRTKFTIKNFKLKRTDISETTFTKTQISRNSSLGNISRAPQVIVPKITPKRSTFQRESRKPCEIKVFEKKISKSVDNVKCDNSLGVKINNYLKKSCTWFHKIEAYMQSNIPKTEETVEYVRKLKCTVEFSARFVRIYLYELQRQLFELKRTTSRLGPNCPPPAHRFTAACQIILKAAIAYAHHVPLTVFSSSKEFGKTGSVHQKFCDFMKSVTDLCTKIKEFKISRINDSVMKDTLNCTKILTNLIEEMLKPPSKLEVKKLPIEKLQLAAPVEKKKSAEKLAACVCNMEVKKVKQVPSRLTMYLPESYKYLDEPPWRLYAAHLAKKKFNNSQIRCYKVNKVSKATGTESMQSSVSRKVKVPKNLSTTVIHSEELIQFNEDNIQTMVQVENEKMVSSENQTAVNLQQFDECVNVQSDLSNQSEESITCQEEIVTPKQFTLDSEIFKKCSNLQDQNDVSDIEHFIKRIQSVVANLDLEYNSKNNKNVSPKVQVTKSRPSIKNLNKKSNSKRKKDILEIKLPPLLEEVSPVSSIDQVIEDLQPIIDGVNLGHDTESKLKALMEGFNDDVMKKIKKLVDNFKKSREVVDQKKQYLKTNVSISTHQNVKLICMQHKSVLELQDTSFSLIDSHRSFFPKKRLKTRAKTPNKFLNKFYAYYSLVKDSNFNLINHLQHQKKMNVIESFLKSTIEENVLSILTEINLHLIARQIFLSEFTIHKN